MRGLLLVGLLVIGGAIVHAEPYDYGVTEERDEFTNEYSCGQRVDNSLYDDSGIQLMYNESLGYVVYIYRDFSNDPETWVWNSSDNTPFQGDLVYIRFPDSEVLRIEPEYVEVSTGTQETDVAAWAHNFPLATKIMSSPGDLRIRFSGTHGERDFTINHGVVLALAAGFGRTCVD